MSAPMQVLVVDDDAEIRSLISDYLSGEGFAVQTACGAADMQRYGSLDTLDFIVLDLMMPGEDGMSICRRIRRSSAVPILMMTAKKEETDRILGLEFGADDYIHKPFNPRELLARIRAILRRTQRLTQSVTQNVSVAQPARYFKFKTWTLDSLKRELRHTDGGQVKLGAPEFQLLNIFINNPKQVISRDKLSFMARGREHVPYDRTIDIQISRLRTALRDSVEQNALILTVRGEGYVFDADVEHQHDV